MQHKVDVYHCWFTNTQDLLALFPDVNSYQAAEVDEQLNSEKICKMIRAFVEKFYDTFTVKSRTVSQHKQNDVIIGLFI